VHNETQCARHHGYTDGTTNALPQEKKMTNVRQMPTVDELAVLISESVSEQTRLAPWEARPAARAVLELFERLAQSTEPVSIADMAPGTTFTAVMFDDSVRHEFIRNSGRRPLIQDTGEWRQIEAVDPSTVRDVTPPPATQGN
jgi:hypothetical protein